MTIRRKLYLALEPTARQDGHLSILNRILCALILLSVGLCVLETENSLTMGREALFLAVEYTFSIVFAVEYLARLWICVEKPEYAGPWGRLKYALSFFTLIDFIALLAVVIMTMDSTPLLLRFIRLVRILRVARLGRFSKAVQRMRFALSSRLPDLMLSLSVAGVVLIIFSTLLYLAEGDVQPEHFGSIPRAMWWGVATLTTVGYGDVYPVTALGRILGACTAVMGIGLIAMPAGILASAFSDAMEEERKSARAEK
ncbi:MAG: ion transporter [Alphaproteobacteria bacterium]|nr:ion transporter [Alphaproteobacteria bacterium]